MFISSFTSLLDLVVRLSFDLFVPFSVVGSNTRLRVRIVMVAVIVLRLSWLVVSDFASFCAGVFYTHKEAFLDLCL